MTDLENSVNSNGNTEVTTTSDAENDFSINFSDSLPQETQESLKAETDSPSMDGVPANLTEETPPTNPIENTQSPSLGEGNASQNLNETIQSPNPTEGTIPTNIPTEIASNDNSSNSFVQNLSNIQQDLTAPQETENNNVSLGKFEDETINTANGENNNRSESITNSQVSLEQPTISENPLAENSGLNDITQNQDKNKLAQKEKLALLIKAHESKAQKSGFIKGILSGVALVILIIIAGFIFAKDQIFDLINKLDDNNQGLNTIEITNTEEINSENDSQNNEELNENDNNEGNIDNEEDTNDVEDTINEPTINEENTDNYGTSIDDDDIKNPEMIGEENPYTEEIDESLIDDSNYLSYTITHVDSEEEANWVLPSHCFDLTCYGEDKEFSECKTFRLTANLDENANRIGKNGVCKYKDSSELVFVEF